MFSGWN